MKIDGNRLSVLDLKLIAMLQEDAHRPNTELARTLNVAESTVRRRIDTLIRQGYLKIIGLTDPFKLGFAVWVVIEIDVDLPCIDSVANTIARMPEVSFVAMTTGGADILLNAMFHSNEDVYEFISKKLARIPGIRNTSTSSILRVAKRTFAYGMSGAESARNGGGAIRQSRNPGSQTPAALRREERNHVRARKSRHRAG